MKLLCVRVRKSTRAVVHTPASEVVGTRYSIVVLSLMTVTQNFSSTGNRPEKKLSVVKQGCIIFDSYLASPWFFSLCPTRAHAALTLLIISQ